MMGGAPSMDFPFLNDSSTVTYLRGSKTLILLRGAPGSGKSTIAEEILKKYPGEVVVCSAQGHIKPCSSEEDEEDAHRRCQECVQKHCAEGTRLVVIDNTNIALWEVQRYGGIGQQFNYVSLLVEPKTPWCTNANQLAIRSSRGFSIEAIQTKVEKLQKPLYPLFYGWFLNEKDSRELRSLGTTFYERCLANAQFKEEFVKHLFPIPGQDKPDPEHYFSAEDYPVGPLLLHCTAFFSNHGEVAQSAEYAAREAVKSSNGKVFTISIIGLLITPRSLGFRLKLSKNELPLWSEDDDADGAKETKAENSETSAHGAESSGDDSCIITPMWPTCGTGSRAHLSLKSGPGVQAVQTGLDLVQIIELEQQAARLQGKGFTAIGLDDSMACGYGEGQWMVIFDEPRSVEALYSRYY